ncbi:hypothetical protein [Sediminibacillus massiliensis]|uniref:hypothetical protein n=1 Tax=Sediminibacillus massiliensis TaxID=1926277 RepID=UPI0009887684|nr:hypothetical protein [Sediminibacillus massiliensis]
MIALPLHQVAWKRILVLLLLILVPNSMVMQFQIFGPIDDRIGVATAIDLIICLPLAIYFFGFRKRVSLLFLFTFILFGLVVANWMIPREADAYLSYFTYSVIGLEACIIILELVLFIYVARRIPCLLTNYRQERNNHYHFLLSLSAAVQRTFTFNIDSLNKIRVVLGFVATDIAAVYYSLFSWRKSGATTDKHLQTFTFHKDGGYLGIFILLVHGMVLEIVAVHIMIAQYSHTAAWVLTALDLYTLLFIIADYQAIRISPVVLDDKGIHFQKGIRQYGYIAWEKVGKIEPNHDSRPSSREGSVSLVLQGLEKEPAPYVIQLKEPVEIRQVFGMRKWVNSVYVKMDEQRQFNETVNSFIKHGSQTEEQEI